MKNLTYLLALGWMLTNHPQLNAQMTPCYPVVAESGLNIRQKPLLKAKKVVTVPFGECVEVEDPRAAEISGAEVIDGISGAWVFVRYQGKGGFAFNGYFGRSEFSHIEPQLPYALLHEGADCNAPLFHKWQFPYRYGLYDRGNGKMEILPIQLRYHYEKGLWDLRWPVVETGRAETSRYLICAQRSLRTGIIEGQCLDTMPGISAQHANEVSFDPYGLQVRGEVETVAVGGEQVKRFKTVSVGLDGKWQILYPLANGAVSDDVQASISLRWVGDLDRDGQLDFILACAGAESGFTDLWLSSQAAESALVGLAGRYSWSMC